MNWPEPVIGRSVPGIQDARLLRGEGRYVDDIDEAGALHAVVLRSTEAHGVVTRFDATAVLAGGEARLVLGPDDIAERLDPLPTSWRLPGQAALHVDPQARIVRYVGQPIGLVVADSRAVAEDLAERVAVDIDPLPAVVGIDAALADDAPLVHQDTGSNVAGTIHFGDPADELEEIFRTAPHVVERRLSVQRVSHSPLEPRGLLAEWIGHTRRLTVWSSTQSPHVVRRELAAALRLRADEVRVVAPDIGGSFGSKVTLYVDEALVCLAAMVLGGRVKWIEDRTENLTATYQGRGQQARGRLALDGDGTFLAVHADILGDLGAFAIQAGSGPFQVTGLALEGPYRFERAGSTVTGVFTNVVPTGAYRGYGMQEASWIRERLVTEAARERGLDPVQLRLRNMIGPGEMPYTTRTGLTYDSGDYPAALRRAAAIGADRRRASTPTLRRGVAVTASVEITGFAPSALLEAFGIDWSGWESARLRVNHDGTVTVFSGVVGIGQGIDTALAQIAADRLGVPLDWITVELGDTATSPYSDLTSQASRSLTLAGGALMKAAEKMRERMRLLAAGYLGADPADVSMDGDVFRVAGRDTTIAWREVASRGWKGWGRPDPDRIRLEESVDFDPPALTYSYSAHGAAVAVDLETGRTSVEDYWTVNDSGVLVNPLIAAGQIAGGVAQGLGIALLEEVVHDPATGRPLTAAYGDYVLPSVGDVPPVTIEDRVTPSEIIPGGFKGLGEGGAIPPPATVADAVADAVPEIGERLTDTPLSPFRVWSALAAAKTDCG
ncbi:xanthine dehydrogenase family protein molybdopterin-binding subunit [Streptomyces sp. NBC_01006]|uniref:xanthine dehydrogenase family protein molybdopterin-binding subunit n=1 Tax=Streptomyces sp. NBC_01006 TaxID=2903716 RepID=UPI00386E9F45|nr:xanthine dehydrogenase family protein molybdopterin-binding subunit [Streptomyces sp. NBC_01006]